MVRAGYEPRAAVELQQTFVTLSEGKSANFFNALFASHPPSQQRVELNRQISQSLPAGKRNRARYQRAIAQIKKDEPAYKKHQEALQALSNKSYASAAKLINQAIAMQPDEVIFHTTAGQVFMERENYSAARSRFETALRVNPDYFMSSLGLGLSQKELGSNHLAKQNLNRSIKLLPTAIAIFRLGEIEEEAGNRAGAIQYYRQVAGSNTPLGQEANARLTRLGAGTESQTQQ